MRRWVFNAAAALSLVLLLGTMGLWVDSYFSLRGVTYYDAKRQAGVMSDSGIISVSVRRSGKRMVASGTLPGTGWGFAHHTVPPFDVITVPHWFPALLLLVLPAIWAVKRWRSRVPPGHCKKCRYDLRASEGRCPECGTPIPAATDPAGATPPE